MRINEFTDQQFAAYVAGFLDGEGCITTYEGRHHVEVCLANTCLDVLEQIQQRIGRGSFGWQQQKPHYKKRHVLRTKNTVDGEYLLTLARPYLHIKAAKVAQALTILAEWRRLNLAVEVRNQAIRDAVAAGERGRAVAARFGLSPQSISYITRGHEWPSAQRKNVECGSSGYGRIRRNTLATIPGEPTPPMPEDRADFRAIPDDVFAAYLAALIDGEGTASVTKGGHPRIFITNTDLPALKAVAARLSYGHIQKKTLVEGEKQAYRWAVENAADCQRVLDAAGRFLQVKASDAGLVAIRVAEILAKREKDEAVRERIRAMAIEGKARREVIATLGVCHRMTRIYAPPGHKWPDLSLAATRRHRQARAKRTAETAHEALSPSAYG